MIDCKFTVESQEQDNHGEIYFSSDNLSNAIQCYIEYWSKGKYVTLEFYYKGYETDLNYGLLKIHSTTDETKIKVDVCDYVLG